MDVPEIVKDALARTDNDDNWVWFRASNERQATVDAYLVAIGHPLAFEAGTPEWRFKAFVAESRRSGR